MTSQRSQRVRSGRNHAQQGICPTTRGRTCGLSFSTSLAHICTMVSVRNIPAAKATVKLPLFVTATNGISLTSPYTTVTWTSATRPHFQLAKSLSYVLQYHLHFRQPRFAASTFTAQHSTTNISRKTFNMNNCTRTVEAASRCNKQGAHRLEVGNLLGAIHALSYGIDLLETIEQMADDIY
jgi:hypothetical protein